MRTILVPEVGDRVTLRGTIEAEPSAVITAVGRDGWFRFCCGSVVGWAHVSSIQCYARQPFLPEDCQGCGAPINNGEGGLCGACGAQDAPDSYRSPARQLVRSVTFRPEDYYRSAAELERERIEHEGVGGER